MDAELDERVPPARYEVARDCFALREAELAALLELHADADAAVVRASFELALSIREEVIGPTHERTALTLYQLAWVESGLGLDFRAAGDDAAARADALARARALRRELRALGDDDDPDRSKCRRLAELEAWLDAQPD